MWTMNSSWRYHVFPQNRNHNLQNAPSSHPKSDSKHCPSHKRRRKKDKWKMWVFVCRTRERSQVREMWLFERVFRVLCSMRINFSSWDQDHDAIWSCLRCGKKQSRRRWARGSGISLLKLQTTRTHHRPSGYNFKWQTQNDNNFYFLQFHAADMARMMDDR